MQKHQTYTELLKSFYMLPPPSQERESLNNMFKKLIDAENLCDNLAQRQEKIDSREQNKIYKKSLEQIKIPIPSLERQQEIVKYLDFIYEKANKTSNEKIVELKQLNEFCLNNQKVLPCQFYVQCLHVVQFSLSQLVP